MVFLISVTSDNQLITLYGLLELLGIFVPQHPQIPKAGPDRCASWFSHERRDYGHLVCYRSKGK